MQTDNELVQVASEMLKNKMWLPPVTDILRRFIILAGEQKGFDRKSYQREYMRSWRKKRKKVNE